MKHYGDQRGCHRPRWITPSQISTILHMIRKSNSIIVLFFFQKWFLVCKQGKARLPPSMLQNCKFVFSGACLSASVGDKGLFSLQIFSSPLSCLLAVLAMLSPVVRLFLPCETSEMFAILYSLPKLYLIPSSSWLIVQFSNNFAAQSMSFCTYYKILPNLVDSG